MKRDSRIHALLALVALTGASLSASASPWNDPTKIKQGEPLPQYRPNGRGKAQWKQETKGRPRK